MELRWRRLRRGFEGIPSVCRVRVRKNGTIVYRMNRLVGGAQVEEVEERI